MGSTIYSPCRVLYIDDSPADQQILREAIQFADVSIDLVTTIAPGDALQLLRGAQFNVVLLDWNLPAVAGVEFLSKLRAAEPIVPIVVLTGEPRLVDAPGVAALGATVVRKPLDLDEWEQLASQLYEQCGNRAAQVAIGTE